MSSGSELSEAYSWLRYVPNRLRQRVLPTVAQGAFNPGPVLVLLYAGKDDPLSLDSVFTPIIHGYRHMLWHLIPGDHLNHWAMIY